MRRMLFLFFGLVLAITGCSLRPPEHITLTATSDGKATLFYQDENGAQKEEEFEGTISKSIPTPDKGETVGATVLNEVTNGSEPHCEFTDYGKLDVVQTHDSGTEYSSKYHMCFLLVPSGK